MRLIDADALTEEIENYRGDIFASEIVELIKQMPTVGEWIPCSERFPEEQGTYFVTFKDGTGELNAWIWHLYEGTYSGEKVTYIDEKHYWANALNGKPINEFLSKRVIAWMPIPEPYGEETE